MQMLTKNYLKIFRFVFLIALWISVYHNTPSLLSWFTVYLYQEFLDIPYFVVFRSAQKHSVIGIIIHHSFVVLNYLCLFNTPFLMYHVYTYMFHHTIKNLPITLPHYKHVFPITWSSQLFIPTIYYVSHLDDVIKYSVSIANLALMYTIYISNILLLGVLFAKYRYSLSAFITYKNTKDNEEFEMKQIV